MTEQTVSYFVKAVKTPFSEWIGCATKLCKDHKKNKQVCHIRPETTVHPIGNGLYECDECHKDPRKPRDPKTIWLKPDIRPCGSYPMPPDEAIVLRDRLMLLQQTGLPPLLSILDNKDAVQSNPQQTMAHENAEDTDPVTGKESKDLERKREARAQGVTVDDIKDAEQEKVDRAKPTSDAQRRSKDYPRAVKSIDEQEELREQDLAPPDQSKSEQPKE